MKSFPLSFSACAIRILFLMAVSTAWLAGQGRGGEADIVLHNGKIVTVDEDYSFAEAVAIQGRRFSAVGSNQEVLQQAGDGTLVIDLKGETVIPGLIDTHSHIHSYAERAYRGDINRPSLTVDWRGVQNKDDVLNQIKGIMDRYQFEPGEWVFIRSGMSLIGGGTQEQAKILYDDLNRWELDKVTPDNPVAMDHGIPIANGLMVNSKAIEIVWERYGYFLEKYGRYWIDSEGRPDGHLEPPATMVFERFLPHPAPEEVAPAYKRYLEELAAAGTTTVSTKLFPYSLNAYKLLEAKDEMTLRIPYGMRDFYFGTILNLEHGMEGLDNLIGSGSGKLWVNSVGAVGVDGAAARACTDQRRVNPYGAIDEWWPVGQCHVDREYRGAKGKGAPVEENYYREFIRQSARNGVRFANTHVAGDRSHRNMLDIVDEIHQELGPASTEGWAFDHCGLVNVDDLPRTAQLGITLSCYSSNIARGKQTAEVYGDEVAQNFLSPVKSMLDAGVKVVFEMDRDDYVWHDLEIFVTRTDNEGNVWGAHEAVDRVTALKMITSWAAEYVLRGDQLGSIEPGKLADLAVLDRDYMTIPETEISEIRSRMTVMDGKIVHLLPQFAGENNITTSSPLMSPGATVATLEELRARRTPRSRR